jgi:hypothetical protein
MAEDLVAMNVADYPPTTIVRLLRVGYQLRFEYAAIDDGKTVYGLQWRDAGTSKPFKDVVVVFVKGKDAASIKFATIPIERLFEPLSDDKHNILVLKNIKAYPRDYEDFLASEGDLEAHCQVLMDEIGECSRETQAVTKKFAKMLQAF